MLGKDADSTVVTLLFRFYQDSTIFQKMQTPLPLDCNFTVFFTMICILQLARWTKTLSLQAKGDVVWKIKHLFMKERAGYTFTFIQLTLDSTYNSIPLPCIDTN
jgi:hypothetical protein